MNAKPVSPTFDAEATSGDSQKAKPTEEKPDRVGDVSALKLDCPDDLPIAEHREQLIELIRAHPVLIVCGETGSGKSTQLPKFCVEAGLGQAGLIGHTQPRRLAARSIATRLAEETETVLGNEIGYQVRFGDQTNERTIIKLMTDGILLAETRSDRDLAAYEVIIIDEAHERSLNIDFLIGYLKRLLQRRSDLRVIITSATIDADRFAEHFGTLDPSTGETVPAPIVSVEGRGYPVEIRYLPWEEIEASATRGYDVAHHVITAIEQLRRDGTGDTLVFLPTERDIREVSHRVAGHFKRLGLAERVELLPLYARLPQSQQQAIFHPSGQKQRIIFATNVAESSLTVPGIRYVIDSGTARISRYSVRSRVQRLPVEAISRASANQRSGRCGRVGPGICIRLYDVTDFESRDAFTTPEIRRTNLASVVLQSKTLRLGKLQDFPLLDVPRVDAIREGVRTLRQLGAIDEQEELTTIGKQMGWMPVDPTVARILIAGEEYGVLPEILPIAAAVEVPDVRDRPPDRQQAADQAHQVFADGESDFLSLLRLWRYYEQARSDHSRSKLTRVLRKQFLSPTRMREWADVYRQLKAMVATSAGRGKRSRKKIGAIHYEPVAESDKKTPIVAPDRYENIHKALLTGLISGVAMAGDKNEYTGAGGLKLFLWPGSGVFESKPKWIVAAELVETTRQYARTVAKIQPAWIEATAEHLLKNSYSDPHWSRKAGGSFCYQRRSLFGLPVVVRRRVPLAPLDPGTARDLLITHGLVEGELPTTAACIRHNRRLIENIARLAAKTRRRDLIVDDYTLMSLYQTRVPEQVCDRARLEKWDRTVNRPAWASQLGDEVKLAAWLANPPHLGDDPLTPYFRPEDILDTTASQIAEDDFPDELQAGASRLPLEYHFRPGSDDDGIHLTIHQAALPQVSDDALEWLVPGQLESKVISMIKSLPKRLRRQLVPAAEVAARVTHTISQHRGESAFMPTLCQALTLEADTPISPADFQAEKLEPHLRFLIRVVDDDGKVLASQRSVDSIKQTLHVPTPAESPTAEAAGDASADWARDKMTTWDIETLPQQVVRKRGGVHVAQFPTLVDRGDHVATQLLADADTADQMLAMGLTRLMAIACRKDLRAQVRHLPRIEEARIKLGPILSASVMDAALADLLARLAVVEKQPLIRSRAEFENRLQQAPQRIGEATQEVAIWFADLIDAYHALRCVWEEFAGKTFHAGKFHEAVEDCQQQQEWLFADGFISWTPWEHLQHYPRYLKAIEYRIDKLRSGSASKDAQSMETMESLWRRYCEKLSDSELTPREQATSPFRWLMEELRVSLFAQPLGTAVKVSPQRCEKLLPS